jgi:hypothetical protein
MMLIRSTVPNCTHTALPCSCEHSHSRPRYRCSYHIRLFTRTKGERAKAKCILTFSMFFSTLMQVLNVAIGGGHARCHLHLSAYVHTGGHARCRAPSRLHGRLAALRPTFIPQTLRRLQLRSCAHVIPAPQTSTPLAWIFSLPRRAVLSIAPFIWYASV